MTYERSSGNERYNGIYRMTLFPRSISLILYKKNIEQIPVRRTKNLNTMKFEPKRNIGRDNNKGKPKANFVCCGSSGK